MTNAIVSGIRSIDLAVRSLSQSQAFYENVWGLSRAASDGGSCYLRGTGAEHHLLAIHERPKAALLAVNFAAPDREAVDALHARTKGLGAEVVSGPAERSKVGGGGYGYDIKTPEGILCTITADVAQHGDSIDDPSRPERLGHTVLNADRFEEQMAFFIDVLGFRLSDSTDRMDFVRCSKDHHSIAVARGEGPSLNHMAYEMSDIDGLMRGSGRMKMNGFDIGWGVGRHGPGDNVFSYFVEPNGFVAEYTTGMQQIEDEASYQPKDAEYWRNFPMRPCRWGLAMRPPQEMRDAMEGHTVEQLNQRSEDAIANSINATFGPG